MLGRWGRTVVGFVGFVGSLWVCSGRREQAHAAATAITTPQRLKPDQRMAGTVIIQTSLAPVCEQRPGQGDVTGNRGLRAHGRRSSGEGLTLKAHREGPGGLFMGTPAQRP